VAMAIDNPTKDVRKITRINLSVVIPTINSEKRIEKITSHIQSYLSKREFVDKFEIIIAAQTSDDNTFGVIRGLKSDRVTPLFITQRGKGIGIQEGIRASKFEWICIIDDDMSYPIEFIDDCNGRFDNFDIFIGSRYIRRQNTPFLRKIGGFIYRKYAKLLFGIKEEDIQSGLKLFRRDVFEKIKNPKEPDYLWDTVFQYYASRKKLRIKEIPIKYKYIPNQLRFFRTAFKMFKRATSLWWKIVVRNEE
jgi:glycosyltransferase involved in cell wall biosynthesis